MRRCLVLLLLVTPSLVVTSCATSRQPPNDEITIRWTAPEEEALKRSGPGASAVRQAKPRRATSDN